MKQLILFLFFLGIHLLVKAQAPISDNSFLIEEAYNQEAGVVQHILNFLPDKKFHQADGSFTQEWPVFSQKHQFSYTVLFQMTDDNRFSLCDLLLNYRYQIVSEEKISISPRMSVLLPTGKVNSESSSGLWGYQLNLPVSVALGNRMVVHINAGHSWEHSSAKYNDEGKLKMSMESGIYGISFIYLLANQFNLMCETVHTSSATDLASGLSLVNKSTIINPGIRYAVNLPGGMQIVPGFGVPYDFQVKEHFYFLYLSVEHSFKKIKKA